MGWGCYKHEWDSGSEKWDKTLGELCDRKLTEKPCTFGRDKQICPSCYNELETALAAMTADRDAQAEAVRVLAHVVRVAKTIPSTAGMEAVARGMTYSGQRIENLTEALVTFDADANPIAAAAVKG